METLANSLTEATLITITLVALNSIIVWRANDKAHRAVAAKRQSAIATNNMLIDVSRYAWLGIGGIGTLFFILLPDLLPSIVTYLSFMIFFVGIARQVGRTLLDVYG